MPIIGTTGRAHWRTRLLTEAIFALLIAGAVTMVYPFLLMLAGSTKSAVDSAELGIVPRFLKDDRILYSKHLEGLFNGLVELAGGPFFVGCVVQGDLEAVSEGG